MEKLAQPEDVGEILVKVQEDLQQLKQQLLSKGDGTVDVVAVETAINKTEEGIRHKTEQLLQQLNSRVQTLPSVDATIGQPGGTRGATDPTALWLRQQASPDNRNLSHPLALKKFGEVNNNNTQGGRGHVTLDTDLHQLTGPTPGQAMRMSHNSNVLVNPYNQRNREVLNENYGIQLPSISEKRAAPSQTLQVVRGSTVEPLAVLPRANRIDAQLLPPPISELDAKKGILSLLERGLIPPAAELTLDPSPVKQQTAPLHEHSQRQANKHLTADALAGYVLDAQAPPGPPSAPVPPGSAQRGQSAEGDLDKVRVSSSTTSRKHSGHKPRTPVTMKTLEMSLQPMPPPTTPASAPDFKEKSHRFAIQHGRVRDNTQEYQAFRQHYCLSWGSIVSMLRHLERLLTNYAVPLAFIHGDKLADLSLEYELELTPSLDELLAVMVNREDVENIITRPGRRFVGPNGRVAAAAKIQATWRMCVERRAYLEYRRKKWAAGVIAISWVMHVKMAKVRKQLRAKRKDQLDNYRRRNKMFATNWSRIQSSKRVIIHIPSLGLSQKLRATVNDFNNAQNTQMGRICDIRDPNVDVIYLSPVVVNEDMAQYYNKLLGLKGAIDSGNVDNQQDLGNRYKIITPEAIKSFPTHRMCLSTLLKYSDRTLKRIRNLIRGREAYIVTGMPHADDVYLSEYLDVPVLAPEPEVARLYTTKSGSKRVFGAASVAMPPGEYDIYSLPQLQEVLAQLVTEHLEVTRWLFKLDDEFDGRGTAYLDVADHLPCYPWALKEAIRYGDKWNKKWAQEAAYIKIHAEIPDVLSGHGTPCNTKLYPTWKAYMEAFLSQGGIVEAVPPSGSVTALTCDLLVPPSGEPSLVACGDQIHAESPYSAWGLSVPQSSVDPEDLNAVCKRVAAAARERNVTGHLSIDLVTFIHPKTLQQELWAVDLDLRYSDSVAMYSLLRFTTGGQFDPDTHAFDIPPPQREEKRTRRRRLQQDNEAVNTSRYAVLSTKLLHTNLSVVHYSVFFQMCRAHGIGYDVKEKQGTVFTLIDSYNRENVGMLSIGDDLQGSLATFARNLSVIHQEISAPNMQGESNFKAVIEDIEAILGTTVQNAEELQEDTTPQ